MRGVVAVERGLVLAVVPVMEVGRDDDVAQRAYADADVGVIEHGLKPYDQDVGVDHFFRESEHVNRGEDECARDQKLDDVLSRTREPVHAFRTVMHGVQTPQNRHFVIRAVRPVLNEIGDQHDQEYRRTKRQSLHPAAYAVVRRPAEKLVHHQVRGEQHEADDYVIDDEVMKIGLPFGAENGLILAVFEELFDEDKNQRRAEQIEDEPVEADVGRVVREIIHRHFVAAEQERERHQPKRKCGEPARAIEDDVDEADASRNRQRDEHDVANHVDIVAFAKLRRGQVFGEVEGEYAEEAQDRQRQRDHAGNQAVTVFECAVAFGEFVEFIQHVVLQIVQSAFSCKGPSMWT